jgi:BirA family transcriptional regulator, biotin operon repressor / biotin---[acetyl-CoA-carboxylase] ligase
VIVDGAAQLPLGYPRLHLRRTDSTNERARELARTGAPHGTLVTTAEQTAGRGRQGRSWIAPPGSALLCSLVLCDPPPLLSLIAGMAVCDTIGQETRLKWPNDIVIGHGMAKLAGILVEGRPQENWAVLGIGINVAVRVKDLPAGLRGRAASLGLPPTAIEPTLERLIEALATRLMASTEDVLSAWRERDALRGQEISWAHGHGRAEGIDGEGHLLVRLASGVTTALSAGEVHLESVG